MNDTEDHIIGRDERNRVLALQLAVATSGDHSDPTRIVGSAGKFLDFLTAADKQPG